MHCVSCLCVNFPVKLDDDIFDAYVFEASKADVDYISLLSTLTRAGPSDKSYYLVKNDTFSSRRLEW